MSEDVRDEGLGAFEASLRGLTPLPPRLDRDRLLFRAGQASVSPRGRLWPWATAAATALAASLGGILLLRPAPQPTVRVVYVRQEAPQPPSIAVAPPAAEQPAEAGTLPTADDVRLGYGRLQQEVLRWGVDALPSVGVGRQPAGHGGPTTLPPPPSYYQLRLAYKTGGEL